MLFTIENENQNSMAFLDVQIIQEDKVFTTSVYQKPTFSGIYTHPFTMHLKAWYCLHTLIDASKYAQFALFALHYTLNYFFYTKFS